MNIVSNTIDEINIDYLVNKDKEQDMLLHTLNGEIAFENLFLEGLYDGVNVTKLDQESVKLTGEQYIEATLNFLRETPETLDIIATDFTITETLNSLPETDYYFRSDQFRELHSISVMESAYCDNLTVESIFGPISNFDIEEFDKLKLSINGDQQIPQQFAVKNLKVDDLKANFINDVPYKQLFEYEHYYNIVSRRLLRGQMKVKGTYMFNMNLSDCFFSNNIAKAAGKRLQVAISINAGVLLLESCTNPFLMVPLFYS